MRLILITLAIFVISACEAISPNQDRVIELDTPTLPNFLSNIFLSDVDDSQAVCLVIDQESVWTRGDEAEVLFNQIHESLQLELDSLDITETLHVEVFDTIGEVFDENRSLIGSYGGEITTCFNTQNLQIGTHSVTIEFQNTQNVPFLFSWSFSVKIE